MTGPDAADSQVRRRRRRDVILFVGLAVAVVATGLALVMGSDSETAAPAPLSAQSTAPADPTPLGNRADGVADGVADTTNVSTSLTAPGSDPARATGSVGASGADDAVGDSAVQPPGVEEPAVPERIGPFGDMSRRIDDDPFALGSIDAPVVMVEFADYRCPFCAKFSRDLLPQILERYVDAGLVRVEWRDLPIFGEESERAAVAGRAAARQDRFWEFNEAVFDAAPDSGHPDLSIADLVRFAEVAGVPDLAAFETDLADTNLLEAVRGDAEEGAVLGVPSVPAFVVNGYPMLGAQPLEQFADLLDGALVLAGQDQR